MDVNISSEEGGGYYGYGDILPIFIICLLIEIILKNLYLAGFVDRRGDVRNCDQNYGISLINSWCVV